MSTKSGLEAQVILHMGTCLLGVVTMPATRDEGGTQTPEFVEINGVLRKDSTNITFVFKRGPRDKYEKNYYLWEIR